MNDSKLFFVELLEIHLVRVRLDTRCHLLVEHVY